MKSRSRPLKKLWQKMVVTLGPLVAYAVINILRFTVRWKEVNAEWVRECWSRGENVIIAFWHGRLLMMPLITVGYSGKGFKVLISRHRDGELIGRTIRFFDADAIRGSSTRGGLAGLKGLIRELRKGYDVAIAPDGPRGPRFDVQEGVILLAKMSGRPIIPVTFSASSKKILGTWDRFLIPRPFARGVFLWGDPLWIGATADDDEVEGKRILLESRLRSMTEQADHYFSC